MNSPFTNATGQHSLDYRRFNRILLNGLIQRFQQPERALGLFRTLPTALPVSRQVLRHIGEQFQRWVKRLPEQRRHPHAGCTTRPP